MICVLAILMSKTSASQEITCEQVLASCDETLASCKAQVESHIKQDEATTQLIKDQDEKLTKLQDEDSSFVNFLKLVGSFILGALLL